MDAGIQAEIKDATLTDDEVVRRVLDGDVALFEIIMRRYNQRLFRVVRSVVKDDSEAEDIIQEAYVRAYEHLSQFEGPGEVFDLAHEDCDLRGLRSCAPFRLPKRGQRFETGGRRCGCEVQGTRPGTASL